VPALIHYQRLRGWKYRTVKEYRVQTTIKPGAEIRSSGDYACLRSNGLLTIKKGYAWDGPSGPTFDTPSFMRGSLVHDSLYQLMREDILALSWRRDVDELLREHCIEDGMYRWRARYVFWGVSAFGERSAKPRPVPKALTAP